MFQLRLCQIRMSEEKEISDHFDIMIKTPIIVNPKINPNIMGGILSKSQLSLLEDLLESKYFKDIVDHIEGNEERWVSFYNENKAENFVPEPWLQDGSPMSEAIKQIKKLIMVKIIRPDRFGSQCKNFIIKTIGEEVLNVPEVDLKKVVEKIENPKSPLLLVSATGFDASYKVDNLAKQTGKKMTSVAIGSPEAFDVADRAIKSAAKTGSWVLLKNIHLAPQWLVELEKMVYKLTLHSNFRLFLTMEFNPKVPSTLIRASYVFVFEPPQGIKAAL